MDCDPFNNCPNSVLSSITSKSLIILALKGLPTSSHYLDFFIIFFYLKIKFLLEKSSINS